MKHHLLKKLFDTDLYQYTLEAYRYFQQRYSKLISQSAITCSMLTIETLEQGVKYVQS